MAFKLIESAQTRWRAVNAPHLVALVRAGAPPTRHPPGRSPPRVRPLLIALAAATVGLAMQALGFVQGWQQAPASLIPPA